MAGTHVIDARALSKLRWRCRRGLLENDLFIERFFARHEATLTAGQAQGLRVLMELSDNDLLDLLLGRTEPGGELLQADVIEVLRLMRTPPSSRGQGQFATPEPTRKAHDPV